MSAGEPVRVSIDTLPPFSGDHPRCVKCGHAAASTEYHPGGRFEAVLSAPLHEFLLRRCIRCGFKWYEQVVPAPAAAAEEQGKYPGCEADSAWVAVWLYSDWREVTRRMSVPERTAASAAIERWREFTHGPDAAPAPEGLRWWLNPDGSEKT